MFEVIHPGLLTTIQDSGRRGFEQYGMPPSGYFDPFLARVANLLVGNESPLAVLEFALIGPVLKIHKDCIVSIAGYGAEFELDGKAAPQFSAFVASEGALLRFKKMRGWFGYLAVAGGFQAAEILGSMSAYTAGALGTRLQKGMILRTSSAPAPGVFEAKFEITAEQMEPAKVVSMVPALHTSLFSADDRSKLTRSGFTVDPQSNRMGIHLSGAELPSPVLRHSAPALPGAIQVPPNGQPIILGPEGPTTGGYPQIGLIAQVSWSTIAAAGPGKVLQFEWTTVAQAREMLRDRNSRLELWKKQ